MLDQMMMWVGYVVVGTVSLVIVYWVGHFFYELFILLFIVIPSWKKDRKKYLAEQARLKADREPTIR